MIKRDVYGVEVEITPAELAGEFLNMGDTGQAIFFNELSKKVGRMGCAYFKLQLYATLTNHEMTKEGLELIRDMGDYARAELEEKTK